MVRTDIAGARVLHHPIIRRTEDPVPVVFDGSVGDAEAFWHDYCEREDVDPFYVELVMVTEAGNEVPWEV